jgi:hypothetical protein
MYPKGGVALWMAIGGVRAVEIGHFQAEETTYEWKSLYPDMIKDKSVFIKEVMEGIDGGAAYLARHGISQEPYKTVYRQRHPYTVAIDGVKPSETIHIIAKFYNGEMDTIWGEELANNFFKTKAVPKHLLFRWRINGITYFGEVYFKEEEIFRVFNEMKKACPDEPYKLMLKPDLSSRKVLVSLISERKEIELKKYGKLGKSSIQ